MPTKILIHCFGILKAPHCFHAQIPTKILMCTETISKAESQKPLIFRFPSYSLQFLLFFNFIRISSASEDLFVSITDVPWRFISSYKASQGHENVCIQVAIFLDNRCDACRWIVRLQKSDEW